VRHCDAESSNGRVGLASLIAAASICPNEQFLNRLKEGEEYPGPLCAFPIRRGIVILYLSGLRGDLNGSMQHHLI